MKEVRVQDSPIYQEEREMSEEEEDGGRRRGVRARRDGVWDREKRQKAPQMTADVRVEDN